MQRTGAECGDGNLTIVGYRAAAATRFWMGDFVGARVAGDEVHRRYDPELHRQIAVATHTDLFTGEGVYRSHFLWILGFPERALAANARRRGHPFDLALHLTLGAQLFNYLGDWETLLARADEAVRIGEERGLTLFGEILAQIGRGVAWLRAGRPQEAVARGGRSTRFFDWTLAGHGPSDLGLVSLSPSGRTARPRAIETASQRDWVKRGGDPKADAPRLKRKLVRGLAALRSPTSPRVRANLA